MMSDWPAIKRGRGSDGADGAGFVSEIVVPWKSAICSLPSRAALHNVVVSSQKTHRSAACFAFLIFGTSSVRVPSFFCQVDGRYRELIFGRCTPHRISVDDIKAIVEVGGN